MLSARQVLYGAALAAWLLTLLLAGLMLFEGARWPLYEWMLIALALIALWRPAMGAVAVAYLLLHVARMYLFEVRPLLDVVSWQDAVGDALYVVWSWARHEIQRGSFALALAHLFREWLMPLIQLAVLVGKIITYRVRN